MFVTPFAMVFSKNRFSGLSYYSKLKTIRHILEDSIRFYPYNQCDIATEVVHALTGLTMVSGFYVDNRDDITSYSSYHCQNYDSEYQLYIDLSRDQFSYANNRLPPISFVHIPSEFYVPSEDMSNHLLCERTPPTRKAQQIIDLYKKNIIKNRKK